MPTHPGTLEPRVRHRLSTAQKRLVVVPSTEAWGRSIRTKHIVQSPGVEDWKRWGGGDARRGRARVLCVLDLQ